MTEKILWVYLGGTLWERCHAAVWLGCLQNTFWNGLRFQFSHKHWTMACISISKSFCWERKIIKEKKTLMSWSNNLPDCSCDKMWSLFNNGHALLKRMIPSLHGASDIHLFVLVGWKEKGNASLWRSEKKISLITCRFLTWQAFIVASEMYSSWYHYGLNALYHTYWKEIGKASSWKCFTLLTLLCGWKETCIYSFFKG